MDNTNVHVLDFDNICRICLESKRTLVSIFSAVSKEGTQADISSKMKECTRLNVSKNDGLPAKICLKCLMLLNSAYDFQKLCENSDNILRGVLAVANGSDDGNSWAEEQIDDRKESLRPSLVNLCDKSDDEDDLPLAVLFETTMQEKRKYVIRKPRKTYKCEECSTIFNRINVLAKHKVAVHGADKVEITLAHKCQLCSERFKKWSDLMEHEKQTGHYGKEQCLHCKKNFSRSYMAEHAQTHYDKNPFHCSICKKDFAGHNSLSQHILRCTKAEKKFQCSYCGKRFLISKGLKEHMRTHSEERPFKCTICDKAFRRKTKLNQHLGIHSDRRPYLCSICGRGFRQSQHLKEHMRVHTGVKPYVCDVCNASFTQGHCLKTHKMKHAYVVCDG